MTLMKYEDEISRQGRLLDIVSKPEIKLHRIELPQPRVTDQEGGSSLDQEDSESAKIKEEQEEPSQEEDRLVVKHESFREESDNCELDSQNYLNNFSHSPHVIGSKNQGKGQHGESYGLTGSAEPKPQTKNNQQHGQYVSNPYLPESHSHTDKMSHTCETCGKMFQYRSKLQRHLSIHTGEKPYLCKICQQRLGSMSALKTHIRIHTAEKPHFCKTCGKDFMLSSALKVHIRTHTGENPYLCKSCGKRFRSMPPLKRHLRIHTGEKPFTCKICGKGFCCTSELKIQNEKPYLCTACGSDFSCRSGLLVHMRRTHAGELQ